jgi:hypothetical protein
MGSLIKSLASLFKGVKRPWQVSSVGESARTLRVLPFCRRRDDADAPNLARKTQKNSETQITGIASTSDYHEYLPTGNEYRKISPG